MVKPSLVAWHLKTVVSRPGCCAEETRANVPALGRMAMLRARAPGRKCLCFEDGDVVEFRLLNANDRGNRGTNDSLNSNTLVLIT